MPTKRTRWFWLLAISLAVAGWTACSSDDDDDSGKDISLPANDWQFIKDDQGRSLILHGVNIESHAKGDPLRMPTIVATDADRIEKEWGWNAVRFLIFWDATMPEPGVIDQDYLDRVEERLDWFAGHEIHVFLDMHQDVYSRKFCCDGAPEWAIQDDGQPFELQDRWFANYFQPGVQAAFDNFFDYEGDHPELQDYYGDAWVAVVERFKNHPAVLGYDIMNEPHPGSWVDATELLGVKGRDNLHDEFDRERLGPFYQRMIDRIREVDPNGWLFFETRYGSPGNGFPSYLPVLTDPREGEPRLVFGPHMYSFLVESQLMYNQAIDTSIPDWELERGKDMQRQQAPLVCGEWGLEPTFPGADDFAHELVASIDNLMGGWTYWSWDPGGWGFLDGDLNERPHIEWLVQPYAKAVAGTPQAIEYDRETKVFRLEFLDRPGASGTTEIYIPEARYYSGGWDVSVSDPEGSWSQTWEADTETLSIVTEPAEGVLHTIEIRPR